MIEKIEKFHNRLSDTNFVWFPFLFLKLKPEVELSYLHRIKMTFCFAPYFVLGFLLRDWLADRPITTQSILHDFLIGLVFFYFWFGYVTAFFWNRRARRIKNGFAS